MKVNPKRQNGFSAILIIILMVVLAGLVLGGWQVPVWLSFITIALGGFLAYSAFKFSK